jgi:acyl-CoA dehydrogenase
MLDFTLPTAHEKIRELIHWFGENRIRPVSLKADHERRFPDDVIEEVWRLGLASGGAPKELGGEGDGVGGERDKRGKKSTNRMAVMASEEIAWSDPSLILNIPGPGLGGPPVRFMGTPEQQKRFLGIFTDPEKPRFGAYGLTEPGAGSDVAGISTTATRDGAHYVLNGVKCYISNGARAEWVVIFATVDKALGRAGHRAFVVEKGTPGFRVGRIEDKMGLHATETAELVLEECRVHRDNLLGGEEQYQSKEGFVTAMKTFDYSRPMVASMAVGIARAAFERAQGVVRERLSRSSAGRRHAALAAKLSDMARLVDAARTMVWRAAWMADEGIPNTKEASMAKAYAAQIAMGVCSDAIQIVGATGADEDFLLEKWFRDIKVFDIFEGTGQAQRIVISKRILQHLRSF